MATTSKQWDGSPARFTDEQYQRSCLIDRGGDAPVKERCSLPVLEPDGTINVNALPAAAAALAGGRGGLSNVTGPQKQAAARKLLRYYNTAGLTPPDSLKEMRKRVPPATVIDPDELPFRDDDVAVRSVAFTDLEASTDGSAFVGYAAVFGQDADLGEFTESIERGAFSRALAANRSSIPMLYDHNPGHPPLATTGGGTLKLAEDARGLRVEANVAKHYVGDAVRELVRRGDIRGMSFGFVAGKGNSKVSLRGGRPHRSLAGFKKILDVSPTWDPAYTGTEAQFRSLRVLQFADSAERLQQFLAGLHQQSEGRAADPATVLTEKAVAALEWRQTVDDDSDVDDEQVQLLATMAGLAEAFIANEDEQQDIDRMTQVEQILRALLAAEESEDEAEDASAADGEGGSASPALRAAARSRRLQIMSARIQGGAS